MQIYIGSFSDKFSQNNLREKLEEFGRVESLRIENEMVFAEMPFDNEATAAILHLNNSKFEGTIISVHKARYSSSDRRKSGRVGGRRSQDPKSYTSMFTRNDIFF